MTKYKENDILISDYGNKKVLGICGQVYVMSKVNFFDDVDDLFTEAELEKRGYKLPEEEFNPENGDTYYYPYVNGDCSASSLWKDDTYDRKRKATVGIYRTEEESDVKLKKILNAIKNLN